MCLTCGMFVWIRVTYQRNMIQLYPLLLKTYLRAEKLHKMKEFVNLIWNRTFS